MAKYHAEIPDLPSIDAYRFENIFKLYTENNYYFYNILKTLNIPDDLDSSVFFKYEVPNPMSWHVLSHRIYGSTDLWWLLVIVNDVKNPVKLPSGGDILKVIKPGSISKILTLINNQL
jgi:hypothetical protein